VIGLLGGALWNVRNWAATTLAAVFGTAAFSPITSAVQHGQPKTVRYFIATTDLVASTEIDSLAKRSDVLEQIVSTLKPAR
jgi:hypothetical protein